MSASLHASGGVLYILRRRRGWRVELYDWDGQALPGGFRLGREWLRPAALWVDPDRRVWVLDAGRGLAVAHSLFGGAVEQFALARESAVALAVQGLEAEQVRIVAHGGSARQALEWRVAAQPERVHHLRSLGRPEAHFEGLCSLALSGERLLCVEQTPNRLQVFRSLEFHYSLRLDPLGCAQLIAVSPLLDGRLVAAFDGEEPSLELFDARGTRLAVLLCGAKLLSPCGLMVEEADIDARRRVALLDLAGSRVQILNLRGERLGSFGEPGSATVLEADER